MDNIIKKLRKIADVKLDLAFVEKLRKDFLMLMKNVPKIETYEKCTELSSAFTTFRNNFNEIFFENFLKNDLKYNEELSEEDRNSLDKMLRKPGWDLYIELRLPLDRADKYISEGQAFGRFKEALPAWDRKIKSKARVFWKALEEFVSYYNKVTKKSGFDVKVPEIKNVRLEGFACQIVGYGHSETSKKDFANSIGYVKEGLSLFRKNAEKRLPLLLKAILPFRIYAYYTNIEIAGQYEQHYINLYPLNLVSSKKEGNANRFAQVISHEMGHHLYQTYLSANDITFWSEAIRGDYEPLDLKKILAIWPDGMWAYELVNKLSDTDPVLALQLDVVSNHSTSNRKFQKKEEVEKAVSEGETFAAPKTPITGYAGINPEEAFCEAIGNLVAYGPRTLDPLIQHWLKIILPNIKTASVSKLATPNKRKVVAYHGSSLPLTKFNYGVSGGGVFWFSEDKDKILRGETGAASTKYIIKAILTVSKTAGWEEYDKLFLQQIRAEGYDSIKLDDNWIIFDKKNIKIVSVTPTAKVASISERLLNSAV